MFYLRCPDITAVIYDFDYRHVASFLNKLGEHEMQALNVKAERAMVFEMHVAPIRGFERRSYWQGSTPALGLGDAQGLECWLRRLEARKKGSHLKISHVMVGERGDLAWWSSALRQLQERFPGDRAHQELHDMEMALQFTGQLGHT